MLENNHIEKPKFNLEQSLLFNRFTRIAHFGML